MAEEVWLCRREGVVVSCKTVGARRWEVLGQNSRGLVLWISDRRMVVEEVGRGYVLDVPLCAIVEGSEKYHQPLFGQNALVGRSSNGGEMEWKIYFNGGTSGTILRAFFYSVSVARGRVNNTLRNGERDEAENTTTGAFDAVDFNRVAFIDPNDPTVILLPV